VVVTGHSHFQISSTSSAKVGKIAKGQLAALVIFQELLEELVLPQFELVDELEYLTTCFHCTFWSDCDCIKRETSPIS